MVFIVVETFIHMEAGAITQDHTTDRYSNYRHRHKVPPTNKMCQATSADIDALIKTGLGSELSAYCEVRLTDVASLMRDYDEGGFVLEIIRYLLARLDLRQNNLFFTGS